MPENISNTNHIEGYEFSEHQKNFWKLGNSAIDSFYHEIMLKVSMPLTVQEILEAIASVLQLHEVLGFRIHDNNKYAYPIQYPGADADVVTVEGNDRQPEELIRACFDRSYDPAKDAPVRFCLIVNGDAVQYLAIRLYALWGDAYSCGFLLRQLSIALASTHADPGEDAEHIDYAKYCAWQNDLIKSPEEEAVHFWGQYDVFPFESVLPFPNNHAAYSGSLRKRIHTIAQEDYKVLTAFCNRQEVSVEDLLLAGFTKYLMAFTDQPVTIGYLSQNRRYEELNDTMGLVNNIWPLRLEDRPAESVSAYVHYVKSERDKVKDWVDYYTADRDGANDAGQTVFRQVFEYLDLSAASKHFMVEDLYSMQEPASLKLTCINKGSEIHIELYLMESAFGAEAIGIIEAQLGQYFNDINNLVSDPASHGLEITKAEEDIITAAHAAAGKLPEATVIALFEQQAAQHPEAIALTGPGLQMSYATLNQQATLLKNYLIHEHAVQQGEPIGFLGSTSASFVLSVLAVLKAGAFYIPVDHSYPPERIRHIMEDAGCRVLLCDPATEAPELPGLTIVHLSEAAWQHSTEGPEVRVEMEHSAYCIFTSGSTGRPKGCEISHAGLANYIDWANQFYFPDEETGNWALISSISFDLTVTSLFTSLSRGKKLWIGREGADMQELLQEALSDNDVDTLKLTPSHIALIGELGIQQPGLRVVICGGEQLLPSHIEILLAVNRNLAIYNEYGPTETTVGCVVKAMNGKQERILIGKPIANTRILIAGDTLETCPVGITGEIYIGGAGLAKGYLNRPELTAQSFIEDPVHPGERLYKTGDLGRWLPDGDIECLGRKDSQLKIRGYRIEPDDIAGQLQIHSDIDQVVVLGKELEPGQKEIVAYFVSAKKPEAATLSAFLKDKLPAYMLPAFYVQVQSIPLTPNGKTDQKALLALKIPALGGDTEYVAPRNELEIQLCSIWEQVLVKDKVGIKDNFFSLGGHSIKATRLINEYQKTFGVRLALRTIFEQVTPEMHAKLIQDETTPVVQQIQKAPAAASYPLSSAQKRMWVLSQFKEASPAYNIPTSIYLADCDIALFRSAVDAVIDRHEILRTVFKEDEDGELRQWIMNRETLGFEIDYADYRNYENGERVVAESIQDDMFRAFDLENGPLIRATLFQLTDRDFIFYYNMHHIVSDGWSMNVMERDVMAFYEAYKEGIRPQPAILELQYKDYASWEQSEPGQEQLGRQKDFWLQTLSAELPVLDLSANTMRPKVKTYNGRYLYTYLAPSFIKESKDFTAVHGGSMFMLLLTTWNILMHKYTGCSDLVVGTPVAGRDRAELEDQIGFYVNTLALRNQPDPDATVKQFYETVVHNTLAAFSHQAYPFDQLVKDLDLVRDTGRDPVFSIMFALQNNEDLQADNVVPGDITEEIRDNGAHRAKFEMSVNFKETAAGLYFNITYNEDVYDRNFVERLMQHFRQLFPLVVAGPGRTIRQLDFLSAVEQQQLLHLNGPQVPLTGHTLVSLFKDQVQKSPDAIAVVYEGETMTYRELDHTAGRLAYSLRHNFGINKGDMVGVQLGRTQWAVASFLGVLMAGAVYIPIDAALPESRKSFIIQDTGLQLFLTDVAPDQHGFYTGNTFYIDDQFKQAIEDEAWTCTTLQPQDLAYIIYTSGTTGQPKGVMIEHLGVVNTILAHIAYVDMRAYRNCLQCSSFAFDAAVAEIFSTLLSGAALHVISEYRRNDITLFEQYIAEHEIEVALITPAYLKLLDPVNLAGLKVLITAGEAAVADKVAAYLPYGTFFNAYGPTEASICATIYKIEKGETLQTTQLPVGFPITNAAVYILDTDGRLMPPGALGEIVIGGVGIARGYLNRPELNKEKFIPNPFGLPGSLYKTGDLGRWLPDGSLEYAGRLDHQVKIRGHRVELQEIEHQLQRHPQVREVAVLGVAGELLAFISGKELPGTAELRNFLERELPEYMLPAQYYQVDTIPLTTNGKVDRQALLASARVQVQSGTQYEAPETDIEKELVQIWEKTLGRSPIGVLDNFFHIGGDSIKGIRIFSEIQKVFSIKLDLSVIFRKHTIRELGNYMNEIAMLSDIISSGPDTGVVDQIVI